MDEIQTLLDHIENETGIRLKIEDSKLSEEETAAKIKEVMHYFHKNDDRTSFLKQAMKGMSRDEIHQGFAKFHMNENERVTVFLIAFRDHVEPVAQSVITGLYDPSAYDLVQMNDKELALLMKQEAKSGDDEFMALSIVDTLMAEAMVSVQVAYDQEVAYRDIGEAYRNAATALKIGQTFYRSEVVYGYHKLGLGKLLYQLPKEACVQYFEDNLVTVDFANMDEESLHIIECFFDNDLNIAETARKLYLHRNTLVYRLDKFEKTTGLDLRNFEDAIVIRVGLMLREMIS